MDHDDSTSFFSHFLRRSPRAGDEPSAVPQGLREPSSAAYNEAVAIVETAARTRQLGPTHPRRDLSQFRETIDTYMSRHPRLTAAELSALLHRFDGTDAIAVAAFLVLGLQLHVFALQQSEAVSRGRARTTADRAELNKSHRLLDQYRDLGLIEVIRDYYDIREADHIAQVGIHRVGTTSVIFRNPGDAFIYKCVLPRYMSTPQITTATEGYKRYVAPFSSDDLLRKRMPVVEYSSPRYVKEGFIEGPTLEEFLETHRATLHREDHRDDLRAAVESLGRGLCELLEQLGNYHRQHLDLAPANIILRDCRSRRFSQDSVYLIDFGRNFLLTEHVGAPGAYGRASLFIAPEFRDQAGLASATSDVYSLGMILLDVLTSRGGAEKQRYRLVSWVWRRLCNAVARIRGKRPERSAPSTLSDVRGITAETWRSDLDELWKDAPHFAALVEDCTEEHSEQRLLSISIGRDLSTQFATLGEVIDQKVAVDEVFPGPFAYREHVRAARLARFVASGFAVDTVVDLFRMSQRTSVRGERLPPEIVRAEGTFALPFWALLVTLMWLLVGTAAILFQVADWGLFQGLVRSINRHLPGHSFKLTDWRANISGRLTALTFSYIAAKYYLNIFATLPVASVRRHFSVARALIMRATGLVSPLLCLAGVLYPRYWPIYGAGGSIFIIANNFSTWRLAARARGLAQASQAKIGEPAVQALKAFDPVFQEWWILYGAYGLSFGGLAALLVAGVLHSEIVFASAIVAINYVKLYRNNCRDSAPLVRGNLARAIHLTRRVDRLNEMSRRERLRHDPTLLGLPYGTQIHGESILGYELMVADVAGETVVIGLPNDGEERPLHPAAVVDAMHAIQDRARGNPALAVFVDHEANWIDRPTVASLVERGDLEFRLMRHELVLEGKVIDVDRDRLTVTLEEPDDGSALSVFVPGDTPIRRNGAVIALTDLTPGESVEIHANAVAGTYSATTILSVSADPGWTGARR